MSADGEFCRWKLGRIKIVEILTHQKQYRSILQLNQILHAFVFELFRLKRAYGFKTLIDDQTFRFQIRNLFLNPPWRAEQSERYQENYKKKTASDRAHPIGRNDC